MILDGELGLALEYGKSRDGTTVETDYWLGNREGEPPHVLCDRGTCHRSRLSMRTFLLQQSLRATRSRNLSPMKTLSSSRNPRLARTARREAPRHRWDRVQRPPRPRAKKSTSVGFAGPSTSQTRPPSGATSRRSCTFSLSTACGSQKRALSRFECARGARRPSKREPLAPIGPQDRDSRARAIANTFETAHVPLAELRHPTKQHLTATEAFDFLPDSELWAHEYDFVRFGEDPIDQKNVSVVGLESDKMTRGRANLTLGRFLSVFPALALSGRFEPHWTRSSRPPRDLSRLDRPRARSGTIGVLPATGRPDRVKIHGQAIRGRRQWRRGEREGILSRR